MTNTKNSLPVPGALLGSAQYWDDNAIEAKYVESVAAVKAAIKTETDLLP